MNKKFEVDILSARNFTSFGFCMSGRKFSTPSYRYAFNGKEHDLEGLGGGGSTYDYGFRIYNSALGKFLSVDPLTRDYSMLTPYQFASNSPVSGVDLDGLEFVTLGFLKNSYIRCLGSNFIILSRNSSLYLFDTKR